MASLMLATQIIHEICLAAQNKGSGRVELAPKYTLTVNFHMQAMEVVAETRVVLLFIVFIVVGSSRRLRRVLGEASVGVGAVITHCWVSHLSTRRLLLLGLCVVVL